MIPIFQFLLNRMNGVVPLADPVPANERLRRYAAEAVAATAVPESDDSRGDDLRSRSGSQIMFSSVGSLKAAEKATIDADSFNGFWDRRDGGCGVLPPPTRTPTQTMEDVRSKISCPSAILYHSGREMMFVKTIRRLVADRFDGRAPDFYREAGISRFTYSKIISHPDCYHPDRDTVLHMARAFQLGLEQAIELLALAGFSLRRDVPMDNVWALCFELGIYHRADVSELLRQTKFNQPN